MRPAAEVHELAVAIERDLVARLRELLDEVDLHEVAVLARSPPAPFSRDSYLADKLLIPRDHLGHPLLDRRQVLFA